MLPVLTFSIVSAAPTNVYSWIRLDGVHHFAARVVTNNWDWEVRETDIREGLGWKPLTLTYFNRAMPFLYKSLEEGHRFGDFLIKEEDREIRRSQRLEEMEINNSRIYLKQYKREGVMELPFKK